MRLYFRKAPVVEINVQLQWLPLNGIVVPPRSAAVIQLGGEEEWFTLFASQVAAMGFTQSERLVPMGAPVVPYQPIYRYRATSNSTVMFHLGQGVFSVNAMPPYRTWDHFSPLVRGGLSSLLTALPPQHKNNPFHLVQVRYVNILADEILQGLSPTRFVTETLNWQMKLPTALHQSIDMSTADAFFVRSRFRVNDSVNLLVNVGEVLQNGKPVALLDLLAEMTNVEPSDEMIIGAVENMHAVIHKIFVELVDPIRDLLEPDWEDDRHV